MSVMVGRCYYVPIRNVRDAVEAIREIAESGGTAAWDLTLPDGEVVRAPLGTLDFDVSSNRLVMRSATLNGPGDRATGRIVVRALADDTVRENLDPDHAERRTRDRHGNRFVYLAVEAAVTLGEQFAEVRFVSEAQDIGTIIALPGTTRDLLDLVESRADAVFAAEYALGELSVTTPDGRTVSTPGTAKTPDEIVAFFTDACRGPTP